MTFQSRRTKALATLEATGMWRSHYEPPVLRVLWRFGLQIRPPHFLPFSQMLILASAWFGIFWGAAMWTLVWSKNGLAGVSAIGLSCATGLLFGLTMALYYAYGRRQYQLPNWNSL